MVSDNKYVDESKIKVEVTPIEARQGHKGRKVFAILAIAMTLIVLIGIALEIGYFSEDDASQPNSSLQLETPTNLE